MTGKRILIIDDDQGISEGLSDLLELEGYLVSTASNGKEALENLRTRGDTILILLDIMMPIMDGYAFREEQRKIPAIASIPVIVLTAGEAHAARIKTMSVEACMRKPMEIDLLLAEIQRCAALKPAA